MRGGKKGTSAIGVKETQIWETMERRGPRLERDKRSARRGECANFQRQGSPKRKEDEKTLLGRSIEELMEGKGNRARAKAHPRNDEKP